MDKPLAKLTWFAVVAVAALIGCLFIIVWYGWKTPIPTVQFVLESAFNGPFAVAVTNPTQDAGQKLIEFYEYHVPDNGIVVVEDDGMLTTWHVLVARRRGGPPVPLTIEAPEPEAKADIFLSNGLGVRGKMRIHWYYFGSPDHTGETDAQERIIRTLKELR